MTQMPAREDSSRRQAESGGAARTRFDGRERLNYLRAWKPFVRSELRRVALAELRHVDTRASRRVIARACFSRDQIVRWHACQSMGILMGLVKPPVISIQSLQNGRWAADMVELEALVRRELRAKRR